MDKDTPKRELAIKVKFLLLNHVVKMDNGKLKCHILLVDNPYFIAFSED